MRERYSYGDCETIAQTPAPLHPIPRDLAGPNLLAEVMIAKFSLHLQLHRQSQRCAHEGVPVDVSTLAGWVGAVTTALLPQVARIEAHAGGHRTAALYPLIETAKLNAIDPQAWLADVRTRLPNHPARRLDELLPWNWTEHQPR